MKNIDRSKPPSFAPPDKLPPLKDAAGLPVDRSTLLQEQAAPSLASVRNIFSGHPADGLTPQRLGRLLRDAEIGNAIAYYELAEQMEERDLHYLGVLSKRKRSIAQLELSVEEAEGDPDAKAAAKLIEQFITRLELQDELYDIMDAIGKGVSHTEILWDTSEGQWMPKALKRRDPRWFRFSLEDGETSQLWTNDGYTDIPPYHFITHFGKVKSGLPIRGGLARAAAWSYLFKNFDIKAWVTFAEVFGQPLRVGKYGPGASKEDKAVLLNAVRSISTDCAAIVPESMLIEFVEAKMTGSIELYEKLANYLDQQVSKAVLGNTGTTDAIAGGHAVGRVHQSGQQDIEKSDAKALEATLNRDLVRPIIDLNMGPRKAYPILRVVIEDQQDALQLSQAVTPLIDRGLEVSQSDMRSRLGLKEPKPGEPLMKAASMPTPGDPENDNPDDPAAPGGEGGNAGQSDPVDGSDTAANAAGASVTGQDSIDALVDEQLAQWKRYVAPVLEPVMSLATSCASYEEFLAKLPSVIPKANVDGLTEALARSMFAARLAAEADVDIGAGDVRSRA